MKIKKNLKLQTIHYAVKCRMYLDDEQKVFFAKQFGCCRLIYNITLDWINFYYGLVKRSLSIMDAKKLLPLLKQNPHYSFLKEVNSQSLQSSVLNLGHAFGRFLAGNGGRPRFKKKGGRECFEVPQHFSLKRSKRGNYFLIIPKLSSAIRIKIHREIVGKIRHIHISVDPDGKYYASLNCVKEVYCVEVVDPEMDGWKTTGYDLGLVDFLVGSDEKKEPAPGYLRKSEEKLKKKQRQQSRKKKGSKNQEKSRVKLARYHAKVRDQRSDFHHQLSNKIVDENQETYFESLSPRNMMKNRCLAKSIGDAGFGSFVTKVKYKSSWRGKGFIQIGRFEPSSKLCSNCGALNDKLKLNHRTWRCKTCNVLHDRDINAAKNIKKIGQGMSELTPVERTTPGCFLMRWHLSWLSMKQAGSGF